MLWSGRSLKVVFYSPQSHTATSAKTKKLYQNIISPNIPDSFFFPSSFFLFFPRPLTLDSFHFILFFVFFFLLFFSLHNTFFFLLSFFLFLFLFLQAATGWLWSHFFFLLPSLLNHLLRRFFWCEAIFSDL